MVNKTINQTTTHNNAISAIRFLSMLMIILCHFLQYYDLESAWWFNVGVQIFFTISGFLYGGKTIDKPVKFYKRAFKKLLIPLWIFVIPVFILQRVFVPESFSYVRALLTLFCHEYLDGLEHLWFIQKLGFCYLLLPLFLKIRDEINTYKRSQALVSIIFVFLVLQIVGFALNGYLMQANNVNCFAVGILLSGIEKKKNSLFHPTVIFSIIAVITNVLRIYFVYIIKIGDNEKVDLFVKYARGFLGIAIFLILYSLFKNIKYNAVLKFSDKYSYHIYLVHMVFILGPLTLMRITKSVPLNIIIICCCIVVSALVLKMLETKVNNALDKTKDKLMSKNTGCGY